MKIICMARNYVAHAEELNNPLPETPVFFMKHENCIVKDNQAFFYPDFSKDIHHELEIVLKFCKDGKAIEPESVPTYFDEIGLGIDFTARDLQDVAKSKGYPWEVAKAFDHSAPISGFIPVSEFEDIHDIHFRLDINGKTVQQASTALMIFPFERQISYISRFITFKTGDLLFTGTPAGVGPVKTGDHLEAWLEDRKMMDFFVK